MPGFVSETATTLPFRQITHGVSALYGVAVFGFSYYGTIPDVPTGYFMADGGNVVPGFNAE
jgi:hypothetical protein